MHLRRTVLLLTVAAAMSLVCAGLTLAQEESTTPEQRTLPGQGPPEGVIPGQYIVVLNQEGVRDPTAVAREHAQRHRAEVLYTY